MVHEMNFDLTWQNNVLGMIFDVLIKTENALCKLCELNKIKPTS